MFATIATAYLELHWSWCIGHRTQLVPIKQQRVGDFPERIDINQHHIAARRTIHIDHILTSCKQLIVEGMCNEIVLTITQLEAIANFTLK